MAAAGTIVSARSGRSWNASRRSLLDIPHIFLKRARAAATSIARGLALAGQRSQSVSTLPAGADEDLDRADLRQGLAERAVDHLFEQPLAPAIDRLHSAQVRLEHPAPSREGATS